MRPNTFVKFVLCATTLVIFSTAGYAQTYTDIETFTGGNAYDEAYRVNTCGSFAYKVDPPLTGDYPSQADVDNGLVFSLHGDPIPEDIVGVIQFTLNDPYVSWSIASPYKVCAVIVKGGPGARVYYYSGGATLGSGLTPPINPNNNKPYGVSHVTFLFYRGDQPMECWKDETAWADGPRYTPRGNWATYTPYVANNTVTLYAGQTMVAGTVHFSAVTDGKVTITITLNPGWRFAPVPENENVKIQDYSSPPSGNPSPGQFMWKGTADSGSNTFSIVVPANNFYGVHVDVQQRVACPTM